MEYAARRQRVLEGKGVDGFLVFDLDRTMPSKMDHANLQYLSGFRGEGALLFSEEKAVLLTDSRYIEQAQREAPELRLVHAEDKYYDELEAAIGGLGLRTVGYAGWRMTDHVRRRLAGLPGTEWTAFEDPVADLRAVKDADEMALLREALRMAEEALDHVRREVRVGMSEADVAAALSTRLREIGSERVAFGPTVAAGPNSALPHYRPFRQPRILQEGDLLLIDFGAVVSGYVSDITRTFVVGAPAAKQSDIYALVLESLQKGIAAVRAGVSGDVPHEAAKQVIQRSPYAEHIFLSPLGHGVGLEVHEHPKMGLAGCGVLEPDMVITVEPGIYIPGYGGIRIEDTVRVAEGGCEVMNRFPKESLIELGR